MKRLSRQWLYFISFLRTLITSFHEKDLFDFIYIFGNSGKGCSLNEVIPAKNLALLLISV